MKKSSLAAQYFLGFMLFIAGTTLSLNLHAAKLYKWVDKDGNITYQDQPPPKNAKILQEDTIETVASADTTKTNAVNNSDVIVVYTVDNCSDCDALIAHLSKLGVPTKNQPLSGDPIAQRKILNQSGGVTTPALLLDNTLITTIDYDALPGLLKKAGYVLDATNE